MTTFFESIGLSGENAFGPRATEFFPSEQATAALRRLSPVLELGGILTLCAEPGMGKSTLIDHLLNERVDKNQYRCVRVDFTNLSSGSFLRQIVYAFEEKPRRSKSDVVHQLVTLWNCIALKILMVVDEAHHLDGETLEDLRLLLTQLGHARGWTLILAGQPPLREMLRSPLQQALSQRIMSRCTLRGWTLSETTRWLSQRLKSMGAPPHFMAVDAMEALFHYAKGNPRLMCQAMTHCLIHMVAENQRKLDADCFKRALTAMEG